MELAGDEKRIQALFSEVRLEDQRAAPRFEKVLKRAQTAQLKRLHVFSRSLLVFASVLIMTVLGALVLWTRSPSTQPATQGEARIVPQVVPRSFQPTAVEPKKLVAIGPIKSRRTVQRRPVRQRTIEHAMIQDAVMLSSWQSPTEIFMESPASPVLKSLPQLDQSVRELESFLPNNEGKEPNQ